MDTTVLNTQMSVLLLPCLLLTGTRCEKDTVFVYGRLGGDTVLPCTKLVSQDCSFISWTFYKSGGLWFSSEVSGGQVRADSDKSRRITIMPNCSLILRDLRVTDAGSYVCLNEGKTLTNIYLSLLSITSNSSIASLQLGGNLSLNCMLFTYYDAGNCKSYSSMFNLSWAAEDGTLLPKDSRYELIGHTRCNITLVTTLQMEDNNRKWRCQVNTKERSSEVFLDFTSTFLFKHPSFAQNLIPSAISNCPVHPPISHIVLCVALPVMVVIVGVFKWSGDRRRVKTSEAGIELHDIN